VIPGKCVLTMTSVQIFGKLYWNNDLGSKCCNIVLLHSPRVMWTACFPGNKRQTCMKGPKRYPSLTLEREEQLIAIARILISYKKYAFEILLNWTSHTCQVFDNAINNSTLYSCPSRSVKFTTYNTVCCFVRVWNSVCRPDHTLKMFEHKVLRGVLYSIWM
jgi:hypothetical protein